jgi:PqqD family protein of HPr-rel-A system
MSDVRYALRPDGLLSRAWEGEMVVYNDHSGETHHLDALAGEVFESLREVPGSAYELTERIAASIGLEASKDLGDTVAEILHRFEVHGLAEPTGA